MDVKDKGCFVPEPQEGGELAKEVAESANSLVLAFDSSPLAPNRKKATPHAYMYDATRKSDTGKYDAHHGPTAASRHFSKVCGHKVPESMARKFRDAYLVELKNFYTRLGCECQ